MTQLASDNFNRANAGTLGANWGVQTGSSGDVWSVNANTAVCTHSSAGVSLDYYSATAAPNDGYAETTLGTVDTTSDQGCGPAYRAATAAQTAYFVQSNTVQTRLYKVVAGAFTQLGADIAAGTTGDVWRLQCKGTTLTVYRNGVVMRTVTDASIASGSAGMWGAPRGLTTNTVTLWAMGDMSLDPFLSGAASL